MKPKAKKPIKTSVFMSERLHKAVSDKAKEQKLSTSAYIAALLAAQVGVANGGRPTYY